MNENKARVLTLQEPEAGNSFMDDDESTDENDDDWEEEETEFSLQTLCLFCSEIFNDADLMFSHCQSHHMFDIVSYCRKMDLNCIGYIKFINYARKHEGGMMIEMSCTAESCQSEDGRFKKEKSNATDSCQSEESRMMREMSGPAESFQSEGRYKRENFNATYPCQLEEGRVMREMSGTTESFLLEAGRFKRERSNAIDPCQLEECRIKRGMSDVTDSCQSMESRFKRGRSDATDLCQSEEGRIKRENLGTIDLYHAKRQKTDTSEKPSAATLADLKIAIVKENFPFDLLDKDEARLIRKAIANNFDKLIDLPFSERPPPPLIKATTHQNGAMVMHCNNQYTADWLVKTFNGNFIYDFKVLAYDSSRLPQIIIAMLTTRDVVTENPVDLLGNLDFCNPDLKTETWKIRGRTREHRCAVWMFEVDREAAKAIRKANFTTIIGSDKPSLRILYDPFTPQEEKTDFELSFCEKLSASELLQIPRFKAPWDADEYMTPFDRSDPLLTFDMEGYIEEKSAERNDLDEIITIPKSKFEDLLQKLTDKEMKLQNAYDRIDKMKEAAKTVLLCNNQACNNQGTSGEVTPVEDTKTCDDDGYYSTYDHFAIHHEMLQDKVRTQAYQEAILQNPEVFQGKRVLDVGCGTAILSMFAAKAGAVSVLGVDKSDVIFQAMDIVRENGFLESIELFKGRVEDVPMAQPKVDIIVSEWMGYFLLFEGMLDSVLYARDKFLNPGGKIFPDRCSISLLAVCDLDKYNEYIEFWDDVYGFQMSAMKKDVIKEANVEVVKPEVVCCEPVVVKELDLTTCTPQDADFCSTFELVMNRDCKVTALVGYFDSFFERDLKHKVVLSTSPKSTLTHWKQTMFLLPSPVQVIEGEVVSCKIACRKNRRDPRSLVVKINFGKCFNQYYIS